MSKHDHSVRKAGGQTEFDRFLSQAFDDYAQVCISTLDEWFFIFKGKPFITLAVTLGTAAALFFGSQYFVENLYHLHLLHKIDPEIFTTARLNWTLKAGISTHHYAMLGVIACVLLPMCNLFLGNSRRRMELHFRNMGLVNGTDQTPQLLGKKKLDYGRLLYRFDSKGVGISKFHNLRDSLEAAFESRIEAIRSGKSPRYVEIILNKSVLPEHIDYSEVHELAKLPPESFYVGMSSSGVVTAKVSEMPHMLIVGTTGGGKSRFFKQALVGLLESSPHLQMYLIDLKRGLEMTDFKDAPNVRIVSDLNTAVRLLRRLEKEMQDRFTYLETKNLKEISPRRDKKDRIILAVDESSVLYTTRAKTDPDYDLACEARRITDNIAKLARAAGIHLFLATQKLHADVITTSISDNISGRMCFKTNSLQGSTLVLGNKAALELPAISGRGIWLLGSEQVEVQVPFIDDDTTVSFCQHLRSEFDEGRRKMFSPMIDNIDKTKAKENKNIVQSELTDGRS